MARSMLSFGMLAAFAASTAVRRRGLKFGSPLPPSRAATVISLMSFVKTLPRFASLAAFLCLMVLHLEWPDIFPLPRARALDGARQSVVYHRCYGRETSVVTGLPPGRRRRYGRPSFAGCGRGGGRGWERVPVAGVRRRDRGRRFGGVLGGAGTAGCADGGGRVVVRARLPREADQQRRDLRSVRLDGGASVVAARDAGPRHQPRQRAHDRGPHQRPRA